EWLHERIPRGLGHAGLESDGSGAPRSARSDERLVPPREVRRREGPRSGHGLQELSARQDALPVHEVSPPRDFSTFATRYLSSTRGNPSPPSGEVGGPGASAPTTRFRQQAPAAASRHSEAKVDWRRDVRSGGEGRDQGDRTSVTGASGDAGRSRRLRWAPVDSWRVVLPTAGIYEGRPASVTHRESRSAVVLSGLGMPSRSHREPCRGRVGAGPGRQGPAACPAAPFLLCPLNRQN